MNYEQRLRESLRHLNDIEVQTVIDYVFSASRETNFNESRLLSLPLKLQRVALNRLADYTNHLLKSHE